MNHNKVPGFLQILIRFVLKSILIFILFTNLIFAQQLQLIVNEKNLTMNDELVVEVKLKGQRNSEQTPQIKGSEHFKLNSNGSSSNISIINGEITSEISYSYSGFAKKEGTFTLGPAQLKLNGKIISSNIVKIHIGKSINNKNSSKVNQKNRDFFINTSVDNITPYLGEQIIFTFKLFYRSNISNIQFTPPDFSGFSKKQIGKEKSYSTVLNGIQYNVSELNFALIPNKSGTVIIDRTNLVGSIVTRSSRRDLRSIFGQGFGSFGGLAGSIGGFGQSKKIRLSADRISVHVKDLPDSGMLKTSGLIGKYKMSSTLSANTAVVGDSLTLIYTLTGFGDVSRAITPKLNIEGMKVYADKSKTETTINKGRLYGKKIFTYALVPQKSGDYKIPKYDFTYFNYDSGTYETTSAQGFSVEVKPGEKQILNHTQLAKTANITGLEKNNSKIDILSKDLMDIKRDLSNLNNNFLEYFLITINIIFILLFILLKIILLKRNKFEGNEDLFRQSFAYKSYKNYIKSLDNQNINYSEKSLILRKYIGDKFKMEGNAMTESEISLILKKNGVSLNLISEISKYLKECDMGNYSGLSNSKINVKSFQNQINNLVKQLEKEIK